MSPQAAAANDQDRARAKVEALRERERSLEASLRAAAVEAHRAAAELQDQLDQEQRWNDLGAYVVELVQQYGPSLIKLVLGAAVERAASRLEGR